jgi:hypothetical protein
VVRQMSIDTSVNDEERLHPPMEEDFSDTILYDLGSLHISSDHSPVELKADSEMEEKSSGEVVANLDTTSLSRDKFLERQRKVQRYLEKK